MYTLKIDDDNSIITTKREVIMQRSSNANTIQLLVPRHYNGIDLNQCLALLEYWLPVSKVYRTAFLEVSNDNYKEMDYLEYLIPCTTEFTAEAGDIHLHVTFSSVELTEDGSGSRQTVRKTNLGTVRITPISAWSDIIPDEALTALDQRVIALQTAARQLEALANATYNGMPTDLALDTVNKLLHLVSVNGRVGDGVDISQLTQALAVMMTGADPDGTQDGVVNLDQVPEVAAPSVTNLDNLIK